MKACSRWVLSSNPLKSGEVSEASYGFVGDPNNPISSGGPNPKTLYYGYLVYAGGY
jgi:hypothetical protein